MREPGNSELVPESPKRVETKIPVPPSPEMPFPGDTNVEVEGHQPVQGILFQTMLCPSFPSRSEDPSNET